MFIIHIFQRIQLFGKLFMDFLIKLFPNSSLDIYMVAFL